MTNKEKIEAAKEKFGILLEEQLARVERMKSLTKLSSVLPAATE